MKKVFAIMAIAGLLAACNNDSKTEETTTDSTNTNMMSGDTTKMMTDTATMMTDTTHKMDTSAKK